MNNISVQHLSPLQSTVASIRGSHQAQGAAYIAHLSCTIITMNQTEAEVVAAVLVLTGSGALEELQYLSSRSSADGRRGRAPEQEAREMGKSSCYLPLRGDLLLHPISSLRHQHHSTLYRSLQDDDPDNRYLNGHSSHINPASRLPPSPITTSSQPLSPCCPSYTRLKGWRRGAAAGASAEAMHAIHPLR